MAANQNVDVLEADGVTTTTVEILGTGRQAAAASKSTAMSTEDKAVLDAIAASLGTLDNSISGNETQVDVVTVPTDPFGANADAASATGSVSAKLRAIATALGVTALDLGPGTGGSRTLRVALDSSSSNTNGRAAAASSSPVVLSNEDKTSLVDDAAFTPGTSNVNMAGFQADETATDSVDEGDAGAARMTLDRKVIVTNQPHTAGGLSAIYFLDIDETPTSQEVKATAGCLYKLRITNRATTARFVKLYNAAAASVTVGTTSPLDTIVVPGASSADLATVITENFGGYGLTFSTGLTIAATTGFADNDTGAPGANDVIVSAYYK